MAHGIPVGWGWKWLGEAVVHRFGQLGQESLELGELFGAVSGHDRRDLRTERTEELIGEAVDVGAAAQGYDTPVAVFALGYSAVQSGLALVPIAIGSFIASGASFGLADKNVSPVNLVRLGLAFEVVDLGALALFASPENSWWSLALILCLYGIGVGVATAQVTNVVLADIPDNDNGQASGIQSAFRQLGSALGIAILTTVFFTTLGSQVTDRLTADGMDTTQAEQHAHTITDSAGAAIEGYAAQPQTQPIADAGRLAMTDGIELGGYLAAGFVLLGLVATALIPQSAARDDDHAPTPAHV
ncbi:MFS transporter [Nocardia sp. NPDC059180]|uniref:MFS transporter n=1 Tax=Nocardia sp. NPDC059180 TaxID=3346761 RepID=UPI0036ABAF20